MHRENEITTNLGHERLGFGTFSIHDATSYDSGASANVLLQTTALLAHLEADRLEELAELCNDISRKTIDADFRCSQELVRHALKTLDRTLFETKANLAILGRSRQDLKPTGIVNPSLFEKSAWFEKPLSRIKRVG